MKTKLVKKIELASFYLEDGAVKDCIRILKESLKELEVIDKNRDIFYAKQKEELSKLKQ